MRDFQKSKVYKWEEQFLIKDRAILNLETCEQLAKYVWNDMGLSGPPSIRIIAKQNKKAAATGGRYEIHLPEKGASSMLLLHELAHSMNRDLDESCDHHGPIYMGIYMRLLNRYAHIPMPLLMYTANKGSVKYAITAAPYELR